MNEAQYVPIRVSTLRGDAKIPFDVYIKVAGKQILYCRHGDSFEGVRLKRLREKKLKQMYIQKDHEIPYKQYLEANIDSAYDASSKKSLDLRCEIIQGFQQSIAEHLMEFPTDPFSYEHAKSSTQRFTEFLGRELFATKILLEQENIDGSIGHHGVNVATIGVGLAQHMGISKGQPHHLLALGCLIHDIDHSHTHFPVMGQLQNFTPDEMKQYKSHPLNGAARLNKSPFVDTLVLNIVLQHEEAGDGSGYPKGLRDKDMDPLVLAAIVANSYDRVVNFEGKQPKEALKYLLIDKMGAYPLPYLQGLQEFLKARGVIG